MRSDPVADAGVRVVRADPVVRIEGAWNAVLYAHLDPATAADVIAREARYFRDSGREVEWKLYGHDRPENLPELLGDAGFVPGPTETLVVRELSPAEPVPPPLPDLEVRAIRNAADWTDARRASERAFGAGEGWREEEFARHASDPGWVALVAYWGGLPVASARLEMPPGRPFAGLWGGGTVPEFRGRGIYRALVAARAEIARKAGYRFLTVDALPTSRPILERLGFVPLTTTTPWVLRAAGPA